MTRTLAAFALVGIIADFDGLSSLGAAPTVGSSGSPSGTERRIYAAAAAKEPVSADTSPVPKIRFDTNFFDFGKITAAETISGVFKFKNTGNGILNVGRPESSCDCTESKVRPDTLAPGESGDILYTIKLERALRGQRFIKVRSNDPKNPVIQLTIQVDYTPLYDLNPKTLRVTLPPGKDLTEASFTVSRTDGMPLQIDRLSASRDWITAAFDSSFQAEQSSARINVSVRRPSTPPSMINATVQMWNSQEPARPVQTLALTGEIQGELAAVPARLYWVIPDFGKDKTGYPAETLTRKIELISLLGRQVELTNPATSIKGMSVQIVPKEPGKTFDLVLKFDELPRAFSSGKVTVQTSLASLPKVEVPVTVAVPQ